MTARVVGVVCTVIVWMGGAATAQTTSGTSNRAFNPAISVIPDIDYYSDSLAGRAPVVTRDADLFRALGEELGTVPGTERGFNLRELEVAFSGSVDPYFDVWSTVVVNEDGLSVEEAYVQTRQFLAGLQLRAGRFLSGLGYINRQHPHQWDFFDQALPYETILAGGVADTGLQVTWLPALPMYLQIGVETLQGVNTRFGSLLADRYPDTFGREAGPRLVVTFAKVAPDLGYDYDLQLGVSHAYTRSHQEATGSDGDLETGWDGTAWLLGTDVVWRYDAPEAYGVRDWKLQAEYLFRRKNLDAVPVDGTPGAHGARGRRQNQDGFYIQGLYGFAPRWTVAGRFDVAGLNNSVTGLPSATDIQPSRRASTNVTFDPTEFSRIRVQYNYGRIRHLGVANRFHQVVVHVQMSLGAHGAHQF